LGQQAGSHLIEPHHPHAERNRSAVSADALAAGRAPPRRLHLAAQHKPFQEMLRRPAAPWTAALLAALLVCQLAITCLGSSELQSTRVQALARRTSSRRALLQVQPASSVATSPGASCADALVTDLHYDAPVGIVTAGTALFVSTHCFCT
jgi:hypothetical protein